MSPKDKIHFYQNTKKIVRRRQKNPNQQTAFSQKGDMTEMNALMLCLGKKIFKIHL